MQEKLNAEKLSSAQLSLILNISEKTIKKLAKEKEIPATFVNRRPQFNWSDIINHFQILEGGAA